MTINITLSYITEIILAFLFVVLLKLLGVKTPYILTQLIANIGIVLTVYGIFIAMSCGLVVIMFNENDNNFTKWLIHNKAESYYRNAAIFTLSSFLVGIILLCLIKLYEHIPLISDTAMVVLMLNLIQAFTMIILVNNYLSLKRKWQEKN